MVDFDIQRLNMVESQVRPSELTDRRIATAMLAVRREAFLSAELKGVAYSDGELVLQRGGAQGRSRAMLAPRSVAQMIQHLELEGGDIVLLVGAGSGYEAAVLSHIAQTVVAVESDPELAVAAEQALQAADVGNVGIVQGQLSAGVANEGPYDAILINGGVDHVPVALLDQLKDGGRLVAAQRSNGIMRLQRFQRSGDQFPSKEFATAAATVLPGFETTDQFVFA